MIPIEKKQPSTYESNISTIHEMVSSQEIQFGKFSRGWECLNEGLFLYCIFHNKMALLQLPINSSANTLSNLSCTVKIYVGELERFM